MAPLSFASNGDQHEMLLVKVDHRSAPAKMARRVRQAILSNTYFTTT
jgi:hypothetical protein